MCNERDRLIAYLYDECDARERDAVREHLDACDECRTEVAGLRSVREDLLAWDVPEHGSVWKPFTPAPPRAWWREVPAWAMAAAAGLVLVAGAAGGAAVQAFAPARALAQGSNAPEIRQATPVSLTADDLASLERRLMTSFSDRVGAVDARVEQVSNRMLPADLTGREAALSQEVAELREANKKLNNLVGIFLNNQFRLQDGIDTKNADFQRQLNNMQSNMQLIVAQLGPAK
ncbi:MAG TPA: zf-HC2 domain-containing protein [Vicinamibacterales bacterium]|nr:zf-HC2 domain-containing protein [Vicinamibacterales bacterium]